jgi:hypothetical protein
MQELNPEKPVLLIFDSISGNLNKLLNQITEFIKENDNEIL